MGADPKPNKTVIDRSFRTLSDAAAVFEPLARAYRSMWGLECVLCNADGRVASGRGECAELQDEAECILCRKRSIEESLRWGEPYVTLCGKGHTMWCVPVMDNSELLGGLMAEAAEGTGLSPADIRQAASDLLTLAEESNLVNGALMELRRREAQKESERAEAIHDAKKLGYQSIRDIYLVEEPALIAAMKRGDRPAAREILNRVLVGIYYLGQDRPALLKSFILELIVTMSRTAVEAGGDPSELLGSNYSRFADLAKLETEEEICAWLVSMLERIMDSMKTNRQYPSSVLVGAAIKYMEEHLHEDVSRDEAAGVACLSPSHFSRVIKQTFGRSFTQLLANMRIDRARELLARSEKSLIQVCLDCGFRDQSYFTKVFQKYTGRTPGEYRRAHKTSLK